MIKSFTIQVFGFCRIQDIIWCHNICLCQTFKEVVIKHELHSDRYSACNIDFVSTHYEVSVLELSSCGPHTCIVRIFCIDIVDQLKIKVSENVPVSSSFNACLVVSDTVIIDFFQYWINIDWDLNGELRSTLDTKREVQLESCCSPLFQFVSCQESFHFDDIGSVIGISFISIRCNIMCVWLRCWILIEDLCVFTHKKVSVILSDGQVHVIEVAHSCAVNVVNDLEVCGCDCW